MITRTTPFYLILASLALWNNFALCGYIPQRSEEYETLKLIVVSPPIQGSQMLIQVKVTHIVEKTEETLNSLGDGNEYRIPIGEVVSLIVENTSSMRLSVSIFDISNLEEIEKLRIHYLAPGEKKRLISLKTTLPSRSTSLLLISSSEPGWLEAYLGLSVTRGELYLDGLSRVIGMGGVSKPQSSEARLSFAGRENVVSLNNIGLMLQLVGNYTQAVAFYRSALAKAELEEKAAILNNLGLVFSLLAEYKQAEKYYLQAAEKERNPFYKEIIFSNLGVLYEALNNPQKALIFNKKALRFAKITNNPENEVLLLNNLGSVSLTLNGFRNKESLHYFKQSLKLARKINNLFAEGAVLNNLGFINAKTKNYSEADKFFLESLHIRRKIGDSIGEGLTLSNLMALRVTLNKPDQAIFFGKQAVNIYQEIRSNIESLSKETQKAFISSREGIYRILANLLIAQGRLPEAQQVLNMLKEEEYFEFIRRDARSGAELNSTIALSPRETTGKISLDAAMENLGVAAKAYDELNLKPNRTDDETKRLLTLEVAVTKAKAAYNQAVATIETELGNTKQAGERMTAINAAENLQDDLRTLGNGTVALYTVMVEEKYHVILTLPTGQKAAQTLIPQVELNKKVLAFREALQNPKVDPRPLGKELYDILVKPIQAELDGFQAQTLMWSLDGVLRYVPMGTLWDGKQYLAERYRMVVYTPAAATKPKDTPKPVWAGLGFGMSQSATVTFGEQKQMFSALPGVTDELRSVIRENKATTKGVLEGKLLLDDKFTEASLREFLRQKFPLVHIASHFSFCPGDETKSFLLLGDGSALTLDKIKTSVNLFSEVDLLTLSACDTAMGGSSGDGTGKEVEGFGVLAQKQGARAVLASLWPVADASTSLLMQEFYRIRQANPKLPKIEALRQAQLGLLRGTSQMPDTTQRNRGVEEIGEPTKSDPKRPAFQVDPKAPYAHPYYWAPFILMGNWR